MKMFSDDYGILFTSAMAITTLRAKADAIRRMIKKKFYLTAFRNT